MKKYVSVKLSDKKIKPIEIDESYSVQIRENHENIYDSETPIPWFGIDVDSSTNKIKPFDFDNFIAFCVQPNKIYLEWWDLAGKKDLKDWKKWNKVMESLFVLEESTPDVIIENLIDSLIQKLEEYVDEFPKNEDGETFKNISVAEAESSNDGMSVYFCQDGERILLKSSHKGIETVLEVFDSREKLTTFIDTMKVAMEEAQKP